MYEETNCEQCPMNGFRQFEAIQEMSFWIAFVKIVLQEKITVQNIKLNSENAAIHKAKKIDRKRNWIMQL